jgi:hypothetical protein
MAEEHRHAPLGYALMGVGGVVFAAGPVIERTAPDEHWTDPLILGCLLIGGALVALGIWLHFGNPQWLIVTLRYLLHPKRIWRRIKELNPIQWRGFHRSRSIQTGWLSQPADVGDTKPPSQEPVGPTPWWRSMNQLRVKRYEETEGVFLIHRWWPGSQEPGNIADIAIRLWQHGEGPLSRGEIEAVEYTLGPKFKNHSILCHDVASDFELRESIYGPLLCLATVYFKDDRPPLLLERYIDFEDKSEEQFRQAVADNLAQYVEAARHQLTLSPDAGSYTRECSERIRVGYELKAEVLQPTLAEMLSNRIAADDLQSRIERWLLDARSFYSFMLYNAIDVAPPEADDQRLIFEWTKESLVQVIQTHLQLLERIRTETQQP